MNTGAVLAQEFGSSDSHWIYNRDGRRGYTEVVFNKDTLIDNLSFNRFEIILTAIFYGDTLSGPLSDALYLNNTNGLVLFSLDGQSTDTLINYNAVPGDSWSMIHRGNGGKFTIDVIDTFGIKYLGVEHQALSYNINREGHSQSFIDTIYEHLGFRYEFILPYDWWSVGLGNNIGGGPLCFYNDALGSVDVGRDTTIFFGGVYPFDCNKLTSTEEIKPVLPNINTLFPNPVSDILHVLEVDIGDRYELYDVSGTRMMSNVFSINYSLSLIHI